MDYNKLIKDIIKAAKDDPAVCIDSEFSSGNTRLTTTLKLEIKVSKSISESDNEGAVNSTKIVLLRIND